LKLVLITVDCLRWDVCPDLTKQGLLPIRNFWIYFPRTAPSLMSFYTGLPPPVHGIWQNPEDLTKDIPYPTIFSILRDYGIPAFFVCNEKFMTLVKPLKPYSKYVQPRHEVEDVKQFLDKPEVFVALHFYFPTHMPYTWNSDIDAVGIHKKWRENRFNKQFNLAMFSRYQKAVQEVFQEVRQLLAIKGVEFIVSSDHGEHFGEQGLVGHEDALTIEQYNVPLWLTPRLYKMIPHHFMLFPNAIFHLILNFYGVAKWAELK